MKIKTNQREGNKVTLEVEADYPLYEKAYEKSLKKAGNQVKLSGFRPGKAPKEMVEKAVDPEYIKSLAIQELVSDSYPAILKEAKLDPIDFPKVDVVSLEKDQPFVFKVEVEVYPEVKLGKYKGIKIDKEKAAVTEEAIMKVLGNLQNRYSAPGPDGKKQEMPLDDEFAKKVSNFGTLAELKAEIKTTMQKDREEQVEADLKNKAVALVSNDAEVAIPSAMTEREVDIMLDELKSSLSMSNLTLDAYLKAIRKEMPALREELKKSAEIRVRGKVVLKAVAEAEKLKISDKEFNDEVGAMARASGREEQELKKTMDEHMQEYINDYLLRKKALDFILEKAKITEVEKPLQTSQTEEEIK